jgi:hypothetical protein
MTEEENSMVQKVKKQKDSEKDVIMAQSSTSQKKMQDKINKLTRKLDQEYIEKQTLDEMLAKKGKNLK